MVNIKPLMGPEHPEVKSVLEQDKVREISPRSLSPEETLDYTKQEHFPLPEKNEKKKLLASLLERLNIISK